MVVESWTITLKFDVRQEHMIDPSDITGKMTEVLEDEFEATNIFTATENGR